MKRCNAPTTRGRTALDGSLRAAPRSEELADFPAGDLALRPVALDTWGPFVFVNVGLEPEPLSDALGSMPAQVAELGLDVDDLVFYTRWQTELEANWKVVCENFLECYHCAVAHPQLAEILDVSVEAYALSTDGRLSSQRGPTRESPRTSMHSGWRAPAQPVPLSLAEPRREHLSRSAEHLHRPDRAAGT